MAITLLTLPYDVLFEIVEHLRGDYPTLRSLMYLSKSLRENSYRHIYKTIRADLRSAEGLTKLIRLHKTLVFNPSLGLLVKNLILGRTRLEQALVTQDAFAHMLPTPLSGDSVRKWALVEEYILPEVLGHLSGLKTFHLQSSGSELAFTVFKKRFKAAIEKVFLTPSLEEVYFYRIQAIPSYLVPALSKVERLYFEESTIQHRERKKATGQGILAPFAVGNIAQSNQTQFDQKPEIKIFQLRDFSLKRLPHETKAALVAGIDFGFLKRFHINIAHTGDSDLIKPILESAEKSLEELSIDSTDMFMGPTFHSENPQSPKRRIWFKRHGVTELPGLTQLRKIELRCKLWKQGSEPGRIQPTFDELEWVVAILNDVKSQRLEEISLIIDMSKIRNPAKATYWIPQAWSPLDVVLSNPLWKNLRRVYVFIGRCFDTEVDGDPGIGTEGVFKNLKTVILGTVNERKDVELTVGGI